MQAALIADRKTSLIADPSGFTIEEVDPSNLTSLMISSLRCLVVALRDCHPMRLFILDSGTSF